MNYFNILIFTKSCGKILNKDLSEIVLLRRTSISDFFSDLWFFFFVHGGSRGPVRRCARVPVRGAPGVFYFTLMSQWSIPIWKLRAKVAEIPSRAHPKQKIVHIGFDRCTHRYSKVALCTASSTPRPFSPGDRAPCRIPLRVSRGASMKSSSQPSHFMQHSIPIWYPHWPTKPVCVTSIFPCTYSIPNQDSTNLKRGSWLGWATLVPDPDPITQTSSNPQPKPHSNPRQNAASSHRLITPWTFRLCSQSHI